MSADPPSYVIFDSGLGGLSIAKAVRAAGLGGRLVYVADHGGFPYGGQSEEAILSRVEAVAEAAIARFAPSAYVIACNTVSTLALPRLRERFSIPLVGTVPAIKPAAAITRTGRFSVLATPATVNRPYTRDLVDRFAADKQVALIAAPRLAAIAERAMLGEAPDLDAVRAEIAPAFIDAEGSRTDIVVLACTHYPLIVDALAEAAPWPVTWLDPAEAIARRLAEVAPALSAAGAVDGVFVSTEPPEPARLSAALEACGLEMGDRVLEVTP